MALGAVTQLAISPFTSLAAPVPFGPFKLAVATVVPTSGANYTAGGDTILPSQVGLQRILFGEAQVITQAATVGPSETAVIPQADGSAKLKSQLAAGTGENAGNANLSASLVQVVLWGY